MDARQTGVWQSSGRTDNTSFFSILPGGFSSVRILLLANGGCWLLCAKTHQQSFEVFHKERHLSGWFLVRLWQSQLKTLASKLTVKEIKNRAHASGALSIRHRYRHSEERRLMNCESPQLPAETKLKWSHTNPSTLFFVTGWLGEGGHEGDPGDSWARHHPQSSGQCQPLGPVHLESADKISRGGGPWWLHVSIKYGSNEESSKFSLTVLGIYLILGNLRKLLFFLCNSRWATWT